MVISGAIPCKENERKDIIKMLKEEFKNKVTITVSEGIITYFSIGEREPFAF